MRERRRYPSDDEDVYRAIAQWKIYMQDHLNMFVLPAPEKMDG